MIVMEYMHYGDLHGFLLKRAKVLMMHPVMCAQTMYRSTQSCVHKRCTDRLNRKATVCFAHMLYFQPRALNADDLSYIATQVTSGAAYLESLKFIHRCVVCQHKHVPGVVCQHKHVPGVMCWTGITLRGTSWWDQIYW